MRGVTKAQQHLAEISSACAPVRPSLANSSPLQRAWMSSARTSSPPTKFRSGRCISRSYCRQGQGGNQVRFIQTQSPSSIPATVLDEADRDAAPTVLVRSQMQCQAGSCQARQAGEQRQQRVLDSHFPSFMCHSPCASLNPFPPATAARPLHLPPLPPRLALLAPALLHYWSMPQLRRRCLQLLLLLSCRRHQL